MPFRLFIQKYVSCSCYKLHICTASVQTRCPPDNGPRDSPKTAKCPSRRQAPQRAWSLFWASERRGVGKAIQGKGAGLGRSLGSRSLPRPAISPPSALQRAGVRLAPKKGVAQQTLDAWPTSPMGFPCPLLVTSHRTNHRTETTTLSSK